MSAVDFSELFSVRVFPVSNSRAFDERTVKQIEERGEVKLKIKKNELEISSPEENGGKEWVAEQVVKAIVYGFEPKQAFKLFLDEYFFEVVDLGLAFHRKEKSIERAKARIIGEEGKVRKKLEELSGAFIKVSNNTDNVSIIGAFEDLRNAKEAVLRIIEGAPHEAVYRFLESREKGL
ncbi:RNA-processing protein [Candidatus Micrarchaeota archaeon]|nr:RNA-processing protein [Candidatus Micrarchaeota archaeon]